MKLRFLGTGAADGIPSLYSGSRVSEYARKHGGKDVRTRCGAVIDGVLKIDFPPDTLTQVTRDRLDPRDWTAIVFTHSHDDHFAPAELQYGVYPFNEMDHLAYTIYGNAEIERRIREMYPAWPIEIVETHSFQTFEHDGYRITPIHANHKLDEDAHNLLIERDGATILYGTDTGVWFEDTWQFLKGVRLDLLVIECTEGLFGTDYDGHLSASECIEVVDRLREMGTVAEGTPIYTTHHSHNGGVTHAELEEALAPHGIVPAYDGLEIEVLKR